LQLHFSSKGITTMAYITCTEYSKERFQTREYME
jgi:hypothetical protein